MSSTDGPWLSKSLRPCTIVSGNVRSFTTSSGDTTTAPTTRRRSRLSVACETSHVPLAAPRRARRAKSHWSTASPSFT